MLESINIPPIVEGIIVLLIGIFLAFILSKILQKIEEKIVKKTKTEIDDIIFSIFKKGIIYSIYIISFLLFLSKTGINETFVKVVGILSFGILSAKLIDRLFTDIEEKIILKSEKRLEIVMPMVKRISKFTIYTVAILIVIDTLGYNITPLLAGMGVAGLAVSLAAKDTISNIIAGIFIIIDKPFKIGDRIEIWNSPKGYATWGEVIDIGLRSTKIKTTDDLIIVIPNAEIARRDIINYTAISPKIRIRLQIPISYDSDFEKAEKILLNIVKNVKGISKTPKPYVIIKEFGESSVNLELRFWIEHAKDRRKIASEVYKKVLVEFKKNGIEIPYPKRDIYIKEIKGNISM